MFYEIHCIITDLHDRLGFGKGLKNFVSQSSDVKGIQKLKPRFWKGRGLNKAFLHYFPNKTFGMVFDDFSKFCSTLGMLYFEKSWKKFGK